MECPVCAIGLREFSIVDSESPWLVAAECPECGALFEVFQRRFNAVADRLPA